jgi:hypothetical protein
VAVIATAVVNAGTALAGYAAAGPPVPVVVAAVIALGVVATTAVRRVRRSVQPDGLAWG